MEEELNYLSEKIEEMENDNCRFQDEELMILKNILIYITSYEIN